MQQLKVGSSLQGGKYRIENVLGQGGFGITYLATQELLDRNVCIKEFFFKDSCARTSTGEVTLGMVGNKDLVERFLNKFIKEARTISKLEHPNIIRILDIFMENGTAYYVMDFIEGESLEDIVKRRGALPEHEAIGYIKQVANALGYLHQNRINHLDVKPANIMVRKADNKAILIDFGVSKQYDEQGEQTSTTPVGISYGYAPIEQYRPGGVSEFSPQADIYALGATLYKLVTSNTPPQAIEIFTEGLSGLPQNLSANLDNAIRKAMQLKQGDRPQSIRDFLNNLIIYSINPKLSLYSSSHDFLDETKMIEPIHNNDEIDGHEYVDLGLSVKWATCNMGANVPEENGTYFAWGELSDKESYSEQTYKYRKKWLGIFWSLTELGNDIGGTEYDVVRAKWGRKWKIPSKDEMEELVNKCIWTRIDEGKYHGFKITGLNGNSIFLPATGWRNNESLNFCGEFGDYWTSTEQYGSLLVYYLSLYKESFDVCVGNRFMGKCIRPVME